MKSFTYLRPLRIFAPVLGMQIVMQICLAESFFKNYQGVSVDVGCAAAVRYQADGNSPFYDSRGTTLSLQPAFVPAHKVESIPADASVVPSTGLSSDILTVTNLTLFTPGDTTTADSFSFSIHAHAGAKDAMINGEPASATISADWHIQIAAAPGGGTADINFANLPDAGNGAWSALYYKYRGTDWGEGHPIIAGQPMTLDTTYGYVFEVHYAGDVPYGGPDLDVDADFSGTISYSPMPTPVFGAGQWSGGQWVVPLTGLSTGRSLIVEASSDLSNWTPIQTNLLTGAAILVTNAVNADGSPRFLRAVSF